MNLEKKVFEFLQKHLDVKKPVLIGVSGGPDSIFLLHQLLEFQKKTHIEVHVLHVNHGWRTESEKELEFVEKFAKNCNMPFHKAHFDPTTYRKNKENEARSERFAFFCKIQNEVNAQGILLGHHKNDRAETTLKQIFEGVSLPFLYGTKDISQYENLRIFRPLLEVQKKEILVNLHEKDIPYFVDDTNLDPKFLRGKMRTTLFPFLNEHFGKDICDTLFFLSKEAEEIGEYISRNVFEKNVRHEKSDWGWFSDLSHSNLDIVEMKYFLRKSAREFGLLLSREQIERGAFFLFNNESNKYIHDAKKILYIDRGCVFFLHKNPHKIDQCQTILKDNQYYGTWKVTISERVDKTLKNSWKDVFLGNVHVVLPKGEYYLSEVRLDSRKKIAHTKDCKLRRLLSDAKVPNIFVNTIPAIFNQDGLIVEDFLCGQKLQNQESFDELCCVLLQRI